MMTYIVEGSDMHKDCEICNRNPVKFELTIEKPGGQEVRLDVCRRCFTFLGS